MFKHILIAHDLSQQADVALRRAAQLAEQHQARLTLLHVAEGQHSSASLKELQQATEQVLGERLSSYSHCPAQVLIRQGKASDVLLQALTEEDYDLLVVGSHHKNKPELFTGTNLERIARHCQVPLLLACGQDSRAYQQAVLAIDSSLCACKALACAYQLLPSTAQLHAVNIFSQPAKQSASKAAAQLEIQQALIGQLVDDECSQLPSDGPSVSHEVVPGTLAGSLDPRTNMHAQTGCTARNCWRSANTAAAYWSTRYSAACPRTICARRPATCCWSNSAQSPV